jgi:hypothetical protein
MLLLTAGHRESGRTQRSRSQLQPWVEGLAVSAGVEATEESLSPSTWTGLEAPQILLRPAFWGVTHTVPPPPHTHQGPALRWVLNLVELSAAATLKFLIPVEQDTHIFILQ